VRSLIEIADARGQTQQARQDALKAARELAVTAAQKRALGLSR